MRAVAPPFPGAFAQVAGERWDIQRTRLSTRTPPAAGLWLFGADGEVCAACGDGGVLRLLSARNASGALDLERLATALAARPLPLG